MSTADEHPLAGQAVGPGEQELAEARADHADGFTRNIYARRITDPELHELAKQLPALPQSFVTLDERDVVAELGAIDPAAVPSIERPDGQPGFTEQYAGAQLIDADEPPIAAEQQREQKPAPDVHELVVTDVLNRSVQGPGGGPDPLSLTYRSLLTLVVQVRRALFERDGA